MRTHGVLKSPSVAISNEGLTTSCVSPGGLHDEVEDIAAEYVVVEDVVVEDAAAEDVVVEVEELAEDELEQELPITKQPRS